MPASSATCPTSAAASGSRSRHSSSLLGSSRSLARTLCGRRTGGPSCRAGFSRLACDARGRRGRRARHPARVRRVLPRLPRGVLLRGQLALLERRHPAADLPGGVLAGHRTARGWDRRRAGGPRRPSRRLWLAGSARMPGARGDRPERRAGGVLRIGHRGAATLAPENTLVGSGRPSRSVST